METIFFSPELLMSADTKERGGTVALYWKLHMLVPEVTEPGTKRPGKWNTPARGTGNYLCAKGATSTESVVWGGKALTP